MISFLAPGFLVGAAALAVPVAIHLLSKPRPKVIKWGAMRFLDTALLQTRRRLRLEELLLLLLRCLCLALLVLAFLRPSQSSTAVLSGGVDVTLLIDVSGSMSSREEGVTRLEQARTAAEKLLDAQPTGSTIRLFACSDKARPIGVSTELDRDEARRRLQSLLPTGTAGDVAAALEAAVESSSQGANPRKQVVWISDQQRTGWSLRAGAVRAAAQELEGQLAVVRTSGQNVPVTARIDSLALPQVSPRLGMKLPLALLVKNTGQSATPETTATLTVDGKVREAVSIPRIEPGAAISVPVTIKCERPGPMTLTARLAADELPIDDAVDRIVEVRDKATTLILDGSGKAGSRQSAAHFLRHALHEGDDDSDGGVTVIDALAATPASFIGVETVWLVDVPLSSGDQAGLSFEMVSQLVQYVEKGGTLLISVGERFNAVRWNELLGNRSVGLLPADFQLTPVLYPSSAPGRMDANSIDPGSVLSYLKEEPYRAAVASVSLRKVVDVVPEEKTAILLRRTDGKPLITSKPYGSGKVIQILTALDESGSDWPARAGVYLPVVRTLPGIRSTTSVVAGKAISWIPPDSKRRPMLLRPDGKRVPLGRSAQGKPVIFEETLFPGVYRFGYEGEDPPKGARTAVDADPRETDDLTAATDEEIEGLLGFRPTFAAHETSDSTLVERPDEWTERLLACLVVVLILESVQALRAGRPR